MMKKLIDCWHIQLIKYRRFEYNENHYKGNYLVPALIASSSKINVENIVMKGEDVM